MDREFLAARFKELGLDTGKFAKECGVSERYMQLILKGLMPAEPLLILMAMKLECSVAELTGDARKVSAG